MIRNIEILCVGNELLIGKTLNTNAQWIAKQVTSLGLTVKRVTVVADDVNEIANVIREAFDRKPQFAITTGGLGPTFDDKTLEGIAEAINGKLTVNTKALKLVREKYETYARERRTEKVELTQARVKMATLPEKAKPIPNPVGTAPGVQVNWGQTILIALPGVPAEMKAIFNDTVAPLLKHASGKSVFCEKNVYVDGVMESSLAPLIDKVMQVNPNIYVKSHPKGGEDRPRIEVHLSTTADDGEKAEEKLRKAVMQLLRLVRDIGGRVMD